MATGVVVTLGGRSIRQPHDLDISRFNITKSGRTANGKMTMDLIAKKRKFKFQYTVLSGKDYQNILDVIDTNNMFFTLVYLENGIQKSAVVYVGEISAKKFRTGTNGWYWKNVNFDLIEQ